MIFLLPYILYSKYHRSHNLSFLPIKKCLHITDVYNIDKSFVITVISLSALHGELVTKVKNGFPLRKSFPAKNNIEHSFCRIFSVA